MGKNKGLFWQLIENEHDKARAYCFRLAGNIDEGDDLYQEAVLRAFDGFEQLRRPEAFRMWLYRIIGNVYKSRFRNPWWKRVIHSATDITAKMSENPSDLYESRRRLNIALAALSAEDKLIVTLNQLEGWTISEIAEMTGKTEGLIKMRLMRARNKMRRRLSSLFFKKNSENTKKDHTIYALPASSRKTE
jgi:RNA polymerase sigma-70 factor (ECF subfamily)